MALLVNKHQKFAKYITITRLSPIGRFSTKRSTSLDFDHFNLVFALGEGAKLATVNFQIDNSDIPKLDGAKPYILNENGTNLASPLT